MLIFTLFHYGALKAPKLPVTIHNAEAIETGILRGVMPTEIEDRRPVLAVSHSSGAPLCAITNRNHRI